VDYNWYVSDYVGSELGFVLPPVLNVSDFDGEVKFPKDPIVGKVQSLTKAGDPTPNEYYEIAKGYRQFIVGLGQKTHAPFRAGLAADYLRAVDVMLLYQDKIETWGLSLSEANLMGIPAIIKDNNDGMSEQARKSGGALVVNDAKEARDALQELLNNEKLYIETATNGQNWCRRNMDASLLRKYL
jgi:glycosyltransferase involved in cell wall biosynthesis